MSCLVHATRFACVVCSVVQHLQGVVAGFPTDDNSTLLQRVQYFLKHATQLYAWRLVVMSDMMLMIAIVMTATVLGLCAKSPELYSKHQVRDLIIAVFRTVHPVLYAVAFSGCGCASDSMPAEPYSSFNVTAGAVPQLLGAFQQCPSRPMADAVKQLMLNAGLMIAIRTVLYQLPFMLQLVVSIIEWVGFVMTGVLIEARYGVDSCSYWADKRQLHAIVVGVLSGMDGFIAGVVLPALVVYAWEQRARKQFLLEHRKHSEMQLNTRLLGSHHKNNLPISPISSTDTNCIPSVPSDSPEMLGLSSKKRVSKPALEEREYGVAAVCSMMRKQNAHENGYNNGSPSPRSSFDSAVSSRPAVPAITSGACIPMMGGKGSQSSKTVNLPQLLKQAQQGRGRTSTPLYRSTAGMTLVGVKINKKRAVSFEAAVQKLQPAVDAALHAAAEQCGLMVAHSSTVCFPGCIHMVTSMRVLTSSAAEQIQQCLTGNADGLGDLLAVTWGDKDAQMAGTVVLQQLQPYVDVRAITVCGGDGNPDVWCWDSSTAVGSDAAYQQQQKYMKLDSLHLSPVAASTDHLENLVHLIVPTQLLHDLTAANEVLRVVVAAPGQPYLLDDIILPRDCLTVSQQLSELALAIPTTNPDGSLISPLVCITVLCRAGDAEITDYSTPGAGAAEHLLAQLPLLMLPQAACSEVCSLFAKMVSAHGGTAAAAYVQHFYPFAWDMVTALSQPEDDNYSSQYVTTAVSRFLSDQGMSSCLHLVLNQVIGQDGDDAASSSSGEHTPYTSLSRAQVESSQAAAVTEVNAQTTAAEVPAEEAFKPYQEASYDLDAGPSKQDFKSMVPHSSSADAIKDSNNVEQAIKQAERAAEEASHQAQQAQQALANAQHVLQQTRQAAFRATQQAQQAQRQAQHARQVARRNNNVHMAPGTQPVDMQSVPAAVSMSHVMHGFADEQLEQQYRQAKSQQLLGLDWLALGVQFARQALMGWKVAMSVRNLGSGLTFLLLLKYELVTLAPYMVLVGWRGFYSRYRSVLLCLSQVACMLTAGMIVATEVYRQEWQVLLSARPVVIARPSMLLVWAYVVLPLLHQLTLPEQVVSSVAQLLQSFLVYRYILHGSMPLLPLLVLLASCGIGSFGITAWQDLHMRRGFVAALRTVNTPQTAVARQ